METKPAREWKYSGVMVTGTDTGVGKTAVAAALAAQLRTLGSDCGVMKPIQTGAAEDGGGKYSVDGRFLARAAGVSDPAELVCPVLLDAPAAPSVAAAEIGQEIHVLPLLDALDDLCRRHEFMIVEGAGGLAVPIVGKYLFADLALEMELPLIVVARASLGTINHTVLTVQFARHQGLEVLGVIINGFPAEPTLAERTAPAVIERLSGVPVLAVLPCLSAVDVDAGELGDLGSLFTPTDVERLLARVTVAPGE
jgi:dethiobiotin synthetase